VSDIDLSGMDAQGARGYVLDFIRSLKETERQRTAKEEELRLWYARVELAQKAGRSDLAAAARTRTERLLTDVESLRSEERDLRRKIGILKEQLRARERELSRSIDSQALLAQLTMLTGETDHTERSIEEAAAELELDELKKKLGGEG
jgi:hypothetical protein